MTRFCPHRTTVVLQQVSSARAPVRIRRVAPAAVLVLTALLGSAAALAQPAPNEPNWDAIRKGPLSVTDQATVPRWIAGQIDQVFASSEPAKAGLEFYQKIATQMKAPDSHQAFKDAIGQAIAAGFTKRYQEASSGSNKPSPLASVFVLMALRRTGPPAATMPAFQAALTDAAPGVRALALSGINGMRTSLPATNRAALVDPIRKLATTETNAVVLTRCYDFLQFVGDNSGQGQDLQIATALIGVLDARLTRIEQQGEWPVVADAQAVNWLAGKSMAASFNNPQMQKDIARVAARLLADAAYSVANSKPPEEIKADLQRIVALVEDPSDGEKPVAGLKDVFLKKVPDGKVPAPTVMEAVASTAPDQKTKVDAAVAQWIGAGQTKGVLTDAFGLPIGLGIQRPAPATASAPAS